MLALSFAATLLAKLPSFADAIPADWFYQTNFPLLLLGPTTILIAWARRSSRFAMATVLAALAILGAHQNLLSFLPFQNPDLVVLAKIHMVPVLGGLCLYSYSGTLRVDAETRLAFLELVFATAVVALVILTTGIALTGFTAFVFTAADIDLIELYISWIVPWGIVATPLVALHIIFSGNDSRIVALPGKVGVAFTPLLLLTLVPFLIAIAGQPERSVFGEHLLTVCNSTLVIVTFVLLGTVATRRHGHVLADSFTAALVTTAMLIDCFALFRIGVRIWSIGLTPTRAIVLGTNLVLFTFLAGTLICWLPRFRDRKRHAATAFAAHYLPAFSLWGVTAAIVIPLASITPRPSLVASTEELPEESGCLFTIGRRIHFFDLATESHRGTIPLGPRRISMPGRFHAGLNGWALDAATQRIFIAWTDAGVEVVDLAEGKSIATFPERPAYVVTTGHSSGHVVWSSREAMYLLDPKSLTIAGEIPAQRPYETAVSDSRLLFVSITKGDRSLMILDTAKPGSERPINVHGVGQLETNSDRSAVYATTQRRQIARIDAESGTVLVARGLLPSVTTSYGLMRAARDERVYVVGGPPEQSYHKLGNLARVEAKRLPATTRPVQQILAFEGETLRLESALPRHEKILDFAVSPHGARLYLILGNSKQVHVISSRSGKALGAFDLPRGSSYPERLLVSPVACPR